MITLTDRRIGFRKLEKDGSYRVVQQPTTYATGGYWNKQASVSPTTVYFGEDKQFFYVLPVNVPRISTELRAELEKTVSIFASPKIVPEVKVTTESDVKNDVVAPKKTRKPKTTKDISTDEQ